MWGYLGFVGLLLVSSLVYAQNQPDGNAGRADTPLSTLHAGGVSDASSVRSHVLILPVRCDTSGTVYFRTYEPRDNHRGVISISADGKKVTHYDLPDKGDYSGGTIYDFFLSKDGKVRLPAQVGQKAYILAFDDQGKVESATPIEDTGWVAHAAALDKGYLILGLKNDGSETGASVPVQRRDYAAVFNDTGKLVKTLASPTELAAANKGQGGGSTDGLIGSGSEPAAFKSFPATDTDGNVYLLSAGSNPSVAEINSSGETIHQFALPELGPGFNASQLILAPGKIAVVFLKTTPGQNDAAIISVFSADGEETHRYTVAEDVIGIPACFDGQEFTFLGNADWHVVLRKAVLR